MPGDVVVARVSLVLKPSGLSSSVYASTLLPVVTVAPAGSQGSWNLLKPSIEIRFGVANPGALPSGTPVGCGEKSAMGPSMGR
ncbi:MAG: hypothetical protein QM820_19855 [Minicystis sp.]